MKPTIFLTILLILITGCSTEQIKTAFPILGTKELLLNEQDLQQIGMTINASNCQTEEYQTGEYSSLSQYSICYYNIKGLNGDQVVIELKKFTNFADLNGSYQYESSHLRSSEGIISENDYGDQSRFSVNNEKDYNGQLNERGVYYYHLWIEKNEYLIHITSKGSKEDREYIPKIGQTILSKFESKNNKELK